MKKQYHIVTFEAGINLAHTTILRWVRHYTPEFEKRWNRYTRPTCESLPGSREWLLGRSLVVD